VHCIGLNYATSKSKPDEGRRELSMGCLAYNCSELQSDVDGYRAGVMAGGYTTCLQIQFGCTAAAGLIGSLP